VRTTPAIDADMFAQAHQLTAVVMAPAGNHAIVDGRLMQVGDRLGGFRLAAITPRSVVFVAGEESVVLKLSASLRSDAR
jgi:hypothetical protein